MNHPSNQDELEERQRLARIVQLMERERERLGSFIEDAASTIHAQKKHMWDNYRDMDFAEKASMRISTDVSISVGDNAVQKRERIERLLRTPYFGRVEFKADDSGMNGSGPGAFYIGVHDFADAETQESLVHDWRAPVSSLYYDFESGPAHFQAPSGLVTGEIVGKRQYKVRGAQLDYMFDSSLTIGDEVLQRELSRSADDRMKNIVATIQREQNAVIRNETAPVLILQGVAGSGKTSIALHRVAFLLYRFKDTLSSADVTILSPNKVFGDYIADVLPELGEQRIAELDADTIAARFLARTVAYQTFNEQVVSLLDGVDEATAARMRFKAGPEFVALLHSWISSQGERFAPAEVVQRSRRIPAEWIVEAWAAASDVALFDRVERVADAAVARLRHEVRDRGSKWSAADASAVRRQVRAMFPYKDALALYRAFYDDPGRREMFVPLARRKIEYADVYPLILTMLLTARHDAYDRVRHLVVDEMQDYTPVQYAVLRRIFACRMTILGDAHQTVNPFSSSSLETIRRIFPEADCLELCRSYRSTAEITALAQTVSRNEKLLPIERHGPRPTIHGFPDGAAQAAHIGDLVDRFRAGEHGSLGIITKTQAQAEQVHQDLVRSGREGTLLGYESTSFSVGVVVTSAHLAKGLEFDVVVVAFADADTYAADTDRGFLHIACTRAMHELHLTHIGQLSRFLRPAIGAGAAVGTHDRR